MFYVSSTETIYRSFTNREEAERYAHLMELRGYPKGYLQVEERRTQDGELETVSIQSFARGKSYEFRYEPVAHNARRRWINAGYQVSLIAMNNAGNFVFDVYDVKG